jgi:hypothetical protein
MKYRCFITKKIYNHALFGIHLHHYIKQQHYNNNKKWFADRNIKQKIIPLYYKVHADLHSGMNNVRFFNKYGIERNKLLFNRKDH